MQGRPTGRETGGLPAACLPSPTCQLARPLALAGESYAGHYVPAVASRVFHATRSGEVVPPINLQGLAIGNGLTYPAIQVGAQRGSGWGPTRRIPNLRSCKPEHVERFQLPGEFRRLRIWPRCKCLSAPAWPNPSPFCSPTLPPPTTCPFTPFRIPAVRRLL